MGIGESSMPSLLSFKDDNLCQKPSSTELWKGANWSTAPLSWPAIPAKSTEKHTLVKSKSIKSCKQLSIYSKQKSAKTSYETSIPTLIKCIPNPIKARAKQPKESTLISNNTRRIVIDLARFMLHRLYSSGQWNIVFLSKEIAKRPKL